MYINSVREYCLVFTCYSGSRYEVTWYSLYKIFILCFSSLLIYLSKLISSMLFFFSLFIFEFLFYSMYFLIEKHYVICFILCRMKHSSSLGDLAKSRLISRPHAATSTEADHGYDAKSPHAARRRHASQPADATASIWVPTFVPVCVGPPE